MGSSRLVPLLTAVLAACNAGPPPDLVIRHVNVVDVMEGVVLEDRNIRVLDGRVLSVEPGGEGGPSGGVEVDGEGRFLIPGLWDMHVHMVGGVNAEVFGRALVANGVLGARDTHMALADAVALKEAVASGSAIGPRLWIAGELVDGPQAFQVNSRKVTTVDEARDAVRQLHDGGADFIKVYSSLTREQYDAIVDEVRTVGMEYHGHVPFSVTALEASEAGQRTFEHLIGADVGTSSEEEQILAEQFELMAGGEFHWPDGPRLTATYDSAKADALFDAFIRNGTWQVPTLVVMRQIASMVDGVDRGAPGLEYVPVGWRSLWEQIPAGGFATGARALLPFNIELVGRMYRAGVPILAGTDFPNPYTYPGFSLHDELELLVEAGMSPLDALRAATSGPARFFVAEDSLGSVAPGKVADLVLLNGNPLEDINHVREIEAVIQGGRVLDRGALDAMLAEAREMAAEPPSSSPGG